jgi:hypothetical protein
LVAGSLKNYSQATGSLAAFYLTYPGHDVRQHLEQRSG